MTPPKSTAAGTSPERKVAVISGASRGLGMALARRLLAQGWVVAAFSRSPTPFTDEASQAPDSRFHFEPIDATDHPRLKKFVAAIHDRHGRIDALINNAAVAYDGALATFPEDRIASLIAVNLTSVLVLTKAVSRLMLLRSSGRIINISSIIGLRGYNGLSVYSASKAGLLGLTRSLARELGPRKITVNAIAPGYLETEMSHGLTPSQKQQIIRRTPLGRLGQSEDVVSLAEFLLSDSAAFITGETITVDGGITC